MKRTLILLAGLLVLGPAWTQQPASYDPEAQLRERARIDRERTQAQESYGREETDCYQRFAVNDCLSEVRKRRRVTLEELRRQEIVLNDERRAAAAAEQLRRTEERAAQRASEQEAERRAAAQKADQERQQRARQKQGQAAPAPAASAASAPASAAAAQAAERARLQQVYEDKQKRAEARRLDRERVRSDKGAPPSRPLPVPP